MEKLRFSEMNLKITYHHLLIFSILVGTFLRFYHIGQQPLWLDESQTYWFIERSILELWTVIPKNETNPPLYYTILKFWTSIFGSSEACLRSLSAVMSIGCIPLVFILGRMLGKSANANWLGAMAALMFSLSPIHIQYAQEARMYAMLTFATTLTLCSFLWMMRYPKKACEPIIRKSFELGQSTANGIERSRLIPWATLTIAITFTLWLHSTSILYIFSLSLLMLAWFFWELRCNRGFFSNMLVVCLIVLLLWGPYLIFLIPQAMSNTLGIDKITARYLIDTVTWLLYGNTIQWTTSFNDGVHFVVQMLKISTFVFLIALSIKGLLNIWKHSSQFISILILAAIIGPILMELLFSMTFQPIFLARTLVYISVPFYIAVACGIMTLRDPRKRAFVLAIICLISLKWTYSYFAKFEKDPWDKVVSIIAKQAEDDTVFLVPNYIEFPFGYYKEKLGCADLDVVPLPYAKTFFGRESISWDQSGFDKYKMKQIIDRTISVIKTKSKDKSTVWYVVQGDYWYDKDRIIFNTLMHNRELKAKWDFPMISIYKFVKGPSKLH